MRFSTHELLLSMRDIILTPHHDCPPWFKHASGLCGNFTRQGYVIYKVMNRSFVLECHHYIRLWPLYTGDIDYPIPAPGMTPQDAYDEASNMYDLDTEYGRNRMALLEYLIECTKEQQVIHYHPLY